MPKLKLYITFFIIVTLLISLIPVTKQNESDIEILTTGLGQHSPSRYSANLASFTVGGGSPEITASYVRIQSAAAIEYASYTLPTPVSIPCSMSMNITVNTLYSVSSRTMYDVLRTGTAAHRLQDNQPSNAFQQTVPSTVTLETPRQTGNHRIYVEFITASAWIVRFNAFSAVYSGTIPGSGNFNSFRLGSTSTCTFDYTLTSLEFAQLVTRTITITSPIAATNIVAGVPITWTTTGNVDTVDILYQKYPGFSTVYTVSNAPNTGTYNTAIPSLTTGRYRVVVRDHNATTISATSAEFIMADDNNEPNRIGLSSFTTSLGSPEISDDYVRISSAASAERATYTPVGLTAPYYIQIKFHIVNAGLSTESCDLINILSPTGQSMFSVYNKRTTSSFNSSSPAIASYSVTPQINNYTFAIYVRSTTDYTVRLFEEVNYANFMQTYTTPLASASVGAIQLGYSNAVTVDFFFHELTISKSLQRTPTFTSFSASGSPEITPTYIRIQSTSATEAATYVFREAFGYPFTMSASITFNTLTTTQIPILTLRDPSSNSVAYLEDVGYTTNAFRFIFGSISILQSPRSTGTYSLTIDFYSEDVYRVRFGTIDMLMNKTVRGGSFLPAFTVVYGHTTPLTADHRLNSLSFSSNPIMPYTPNRTYPLVVGGIDNITWYAEPSISNIRIDCEKYNSTSLTWAFLETITASTPNDGLYEWSIPESYRDGIYRLKLSDTMSTTICYTFHANIFEQREGVDLSLFNIANGAPIKTSEYIKLSAWPTAAACRVSTVLGGGTYPDLSIPFSIEMNLFVNSMSSATTFTLFEIMDAYGAGVSLRDNRTNFIDSSGRVMSPGAGGNNYTYKLTVRAPNDYDVRFGSFYRAFTWPLLPFDDIYIRFGYSSLAQYEHIMTGLKLTVLSSIDVTSPNGPEQFYQNQTYEITWDAISVSNVNISLEEDSSFYATISDSTPSDGSFNWTVPFSIAPGQYKVVIKDTGSSVSDESDAEFDILSPYINIITPNGTEIWEMNNTEEITWEAEGLDTVSILLTYANLTLLWPIVENTPNDGSYNWAIPTNLSEGSYLVHIINGTFEDGGLLSLIEQRVWAVSIYLTGAAQLVHAIQYCDTHVAFSSLNTINITNSGNIDINRVYLNFTTVFTNGTNTFHPNGIVWVNDGTTSRKYFSDRLSFTYLEWEENETRAYRLDWSILPSVPIGHYTASLRVTVQAGGLTVSTTHVPVSLIIEEPSEGATISILSPDPFFVPPVYAGHTSASNSIVIFDNSTGSLSMGAIYFNLTGALSNGTHIIPIVNLTLLDSINVSFTTPHQRIVLPTFDIHILKLQVSIPRFTPPGNYSTTLTIKHENSSTSLTIPFYTDVLISPDDALTNFTLFKTGAAFCYPYPTPILASTFMSQHTGLYWIGMYEPLMQRYVYYFAYGGGVDFYFNYGNSYLLGAEEGGTYSFMGISPTGNYTIPTNRSFVGNPTNESVLISVIFDQSPGVVWVGILNTTENRYHYYYRSGYTNIAVRPLESIFIGTLAEEEIVF